MVKAQPSRRQWEDGHSKALRARRKNGYKYTKRSTVSRKKGLVRGKQSITFFDLQPALISERGAVDWLIERGVLLHPDCAACGGATVWKDPAKWRCTDTSCDKVVSARTGTFWGLFPRWPIHHLLLLVYEWCHETPLVQIQLKLGHVDSPSFYKIIDKLQQLVARLDDPGRLGGAGKIVEADEYEQGRAQKGVYGHPNSVKADIGGCFDRETGKCFLTKYAKV